MWILLLETILLVSLDKKSEAVSLTHTEVNIANNAEAYTNGQHSGYEPTAWDGLEQSIDAIATKRIKVAINGGALNPGGLAVRVAALVGTQVLQVTRILY